MSSATNHLGLTLTGVAAGDRSKTFGEWRQIINGETGSSNMELIDAAFGDLQSRIEKNKSDIENIKSSAENPFDNLYIIRGGDAFVTTPGDG